MKKTSRNTRRSRGSMRFRTYRDEQYMDLNLYQYGREKCEPLHSFGPYVRNHYLFHYVISGRGVFVPGHAEAERYALKAGQGFLIFPHQETTYYADKADPWEYIWIEFDGMRAGEASYRAGLSQEDPVYQSSSPEAGEKLYGHMNTLLEAEEASGLYLTAQAYLFLDQLITSSDKKRKARNTRLRDFYVREAINYIERYYYSNISVEDLADVCALDRSYFSKIFKDAVGQSPQQFLIAYRMAKAREALKSSSLPIKEIAASCGYPNPLHFSAAFKKFHGESPSSWRRHAQNGA